MDVHKETTDVAFVSTEDSTVSFYGTIPTNSRSALNIIKKFANKASHLCVVYEAGPCGSWLYRLLKHKGIECWVVAPSLIPKAPGDKVKTDRRDAMTLARLAKADLIQSIHIPDAHDEAIRDLIRCREDCMVDLRQARQRLKSFILRNGLSYSGRDNWSDAHKCHLADLRFYEPAQNITFQHYRSIVETRYQQLQHTERELEVVVQQWRWYPLVQFLTVFRGIRFISAVYLVAELGDLRRFASPCSLMNFVGLTPSEHSRGQRQQQGTITKCGNTHARRILIEAAWSYRFPPKVSRELQIRQQEHSPKLLQRSWEAQLRLCNKFRRMNARGKEHSKVVTAVVRELLGLIWDVGQRFNPESHSVG